jgi:hypothetical protein
LVHVLHDEDAGLHFRRYSSNPVSFVDASLHETSAEPSALLTALILEGVAGMLDVSGVVTETTLE